MHPGRPIGLLVRLLAGLGTIAPEALMPALGAPIHRRVAPGKSGVLKAQRAARKARNVQRYKRSVRNA